MMNASLALKRPQTGAYLLEALIGILIFALGVLGIVGLQAASLRTTSDSALRAEAVFSANQLLGQMWTDSELNYPAYTSGVAGQPYKDFAGLVQSAQGGAYACDPTVLLDNFAGAPSPQSHSVTIQIFWQSETGDFNASCGAGKIKIHSYTTSGVIGKNGTS
jgi:type IV pilus assembly protein PilV